MTEPYYGRCDTCGRVMREPGRVKVYSTSVGELSFRFCHGACRRVFVERDDRTNVPPVPAIREVQ